MDQIPEAFPPLTAYGISLSVTRERENSVLELQGNAGQLAMLRQIIKICQDDFELPFEKENDVPEVVLEQTQIDLCALKPLKIAVVGAFDANKPSLVNCYVKENFRGNELKKNLVAESVRHKVQKSKGKINIEVREINIHHFQWDEMSDYLSSVDVIVLNVNATNKGGESLASIKAVLYKILNYFSYPMVPLIIAGIRLELGKSPRQERVETFAESLAIPYVECFINRSMPVTPVFNLAIDMAMHKKMPIYKYRMKAKNVNTENFVSHDFYQKLNRQIAILFPCGQLSFISFDPNVDLYHRVTHSLEEQDAYLTLLNFQINHVKRKVLPLQKEAQAYLRQLEKNSLGQKIFDWLSYELEQGSIKTKSIIKTLKALSIFINVRLYTLIFTVSSANSEVLCEFLRDNKHIVNLTLIFNNTLNAEELDKLGDTLRGCSALRHLKFEMKSHVRIKDYSGFKNVFESQPTLLSLDLNQCELYPASIIQILEWVSRNPVLSMLNLSRNYFVSETVHALKYLLRQNPSLTQLCISDSRLSSSDLSSVLRVSWQPLLLRDLDISRNQLSEVGVANLLKGLVKNPQLRNLDMSFCLLSYAAMSLLLAGLEKIDTLLALNLAGNFGQSTREWLVKIIAFLRANEGLKKINLSQNPLLDDGVQLVANFLRQNRSLESIDISQTTMTDMGLIALSEALQVNTSLHELLMGKNTYTLAGVSVLQSALNKNTGLFSLDIGESVECKDTLGNLIGCIPDNTRLRAFGFMPSQKKRTVELLAHYENAFLGNTIITSTHHDFSCRCGRCLCVKAREIVWRVEENHLNRYKNLALLIKAYLNPAEDHLALLVFKRIPKDVLLAIFKKAYPELPPKVLRSVSSVLFFKPQQTVKRVCVDKETVVSSSLPAVMLNFLDVEVVLKQEAEDVVLMLSSETTDYQTLRCMAELFREKIHLILPYGNNYEVDSVSIEPKKIVPVHEDSEEELYFRVAVMGEVGSGKTLFVNRFVHDVYEENLKASIGVDFKEKSIMLGQTRCKLHLFDFAGTRSRDTSTHMFLRNAEGFFLTVDLTRPEGYEKTYKRILSQSAYPHIPIIMVGLKSDISRPEGVRNFRLIAAKLNLPCMIVSAKTSQNVNEVFDMLLSMMVTQKLPSYVAQLRIRKITLDWFTLPRFYGDLNQLFLEGVTLYRPVVRRNFTRPYYFGALQWLREKNDAIALCKFYIRNAESDDDFIRADAIENMAQIRAKSPEGLASVIKLFHQELLQENNSAVRCQAVDGLRWLGELHTPRVKKICLSVFEHMEFSANSTLDKIIKNIGDYKHADLIRECMVALSSVHASCFSILREMGANQACDHIENRVLQALDVYLKRLQLPPVDFSRNKLGLFKK